MTATSTSWVDAGRSSGRPDLAAEPLEYLVDCLSAVGHDAHET
jgi:hypothetical protein